MPNELQEERKYEEMYGILDYAKNKKEDDPKLVKNQIMKLYWFKCKNVVNRLN